MYRYIHKNKNGKEATILLDSKEDLNLASGWYVSREGYLGGWGYLENNKRQKVYLHHLILPKKKGFVVDHINRNSCDNRRENLRYLTYSENKRNSNKNGLGVCQPKYLENYPKKFVSYLMVNGKNHHLGYSKTFEEALEKRKQAEKELIKS